MFYRLPPAGEALALERTPAATQWLQNYFAPQAVHYYGAGAQALAAALIALRPRRPQATHVLLPAYACPELVSAVLRAGLEPRLVDLAPERPWLDLAALRSALDDSVLAVIAVDLFGIEERYAALREAIGRDIALVQDSAQAFRRDVHPAADCAILSFGRGKPVSVLEGGAVLARAADIVANLPRPVTTACGGDLKRRLYNFLRAPRLYWLPQALPLGLGATRFKPLTAIEGLCDATLALLPANIAHQLAPAAVRQAQMRALVAKTRALDLAQACGADTATLLRYPVLAPDAATATHWFEKLNAAGTGASRLYRAALADIEGLRERLGGDYPHARDFAARLITLPLHRDVEPRALRAIAKALAD